MPAVLDEPASRDAGAGEEPVSRDAGAGVEAPASRDAGAEEEEPASRDASAGVPGVQERASRDALDVNPVREQADALKALQSLEMPARRAKSLLDQAKAEEPELRTAAQLVRAVLLRV